MISLQRGTRGKLAQYLDITQDMTLSMQTAGTAVYDCTCFGVDSAGKLSDDRYMIFYNQPQSPTGEINYAQQGQVTQFRFRLSALPDHIQKLVFTVSIDGAGTMGQIQSHIVSVSQNGIEQLRLSLNGSDFQQERAIISVEIYRKDEWRYAAVANGFNGGLADLLRFFGGEEVTEQSAPQAAPVPAAPIPAASAPTAAAPKKISLEKKLEQHAPQLVSLAKPIMNEIARCGLADEYARVALIMDISGSMTTRYRNGTVQEIVNKTLPLAVQFDDDGQLDFWYYGTRCRKMPDVTMRNYQNAVPPEWREIRKILGGSNNEPLVMQEVIAEFGNSPVPAYILFITDGGVSQTGKIKQLLRDASQLPIFWQFVGIGGSHYGILEQLDDLDGRYVDNANFFALDDFMTVSNEELYRRLLAEFPGWICTVRSLGMIR